MRPTGWTLTSKAAMLRGICLPGPSRLFKVAGTPHRSPITLHAGPSYAAVESDFRAA